MTKTLKKRVPTTTELRREALRVFGAGASVDTYWKGRVVLRDADERLIEIETPGMAESKRTALTVLRALPSKVSGTRSARVTESAMKRGTHVALAGREPVDSEFLKAWAQKESEGYQYGREALEQVRFGWDMAMIQNSHGEQVAGGALRSRK